MDKPLEDLDRHFQLPAIRSIDRSRPLLWLRMGWEDLRSNPVPSLAYGMLVAIAGYLILAYASNMPHLFTAAVSGFFLIGPIMAAGLYVIAEQREQGHAIGFTASLKALRGHGEQLMFYGLFLALGLVAWERLSAILFALFSDPTIGNATHFFRDIFLSGAHLGFLTAYTLFGAVIAMTVFAVSVVAIPMLMHRQTDIATAMMTSLRAVAVNLPAMALWAALIVAGVLIGFATMLIGMVVVLPILGYASWHAYRDMVE